MAPSSRQKGFLLQSLIMQVNISKFEPLSLPYFNRHIRKLIFVWQGNGTWFCLTTVAPEFIIPFGIATSVAGTMTSSLWQPNKIS